MGRELKLLLVSLELEGLLPDLTDDREGPDDDDCSDLLDGLLQPLQGLLDLLVGRLGVEQGGTLNLLESHSLLLPLVPPCTWVMLRMFSLRAATSLDSSSWNLPSSTALLAFFVSVEEERESREVLMVPSMPLEIWSCFY